MKEERLSVKNEKHSGGKKKKSHVVIIKGQEAPLATKLCHHHFLRSGILMQR